MCDICERTVCPSACPNYEAAEAAEGVRFSFFLREYATVPYAKEKREEMDGTEQRRGIYRYPRA